MSAGPSTTQEFHYVRTTGPDGGVAMCEGPAIGLDLESLLRAGLPPWKIALTIVAALCEILDIAEEDHEVHGDLSPRFAFIDDTGAVSLEGFGVPRSKTAAPEGQPRGPATDLYGLGTIAYRLCCVLPLPTFSSDDPDVHDDAVIDAILQIDLTGVNDEIQGDFQWFLAKLLSFDREDRPSPVEVWRSFIAFADAVPGPDFTKWCAQAVEGRGERRQELRKAPAGPPAAAAPTSADEDLGGPVKQSGPLAAGAIAFGDSAAKGQATAFWSRDAMKAALERADEEEKTYRPPAGGSTEFWSKDQRQAMAAGTAEAPRPKRSTGDSRSGGIPASSIAPAAPARPAAPPPSPAKPPSTGNAGGGAAAEPVRPQPTPSPVRPAGSSLAPASSSPGTNASSSATPPTAAAGPRGGTAPVAVQAARTDAARPVAAASLPSEEPPASRTGLYAVIGIVLLLVVVGVACAGLGGLGGAIAWWQASTGATVSAPAPVPPRPAPRPVPSPSPSPAPAPAPAPSASPSPAPVPVPSAQPSPSPRPGPTPSPSPSPSPRPSPSVRPSPSPAPEPSPSPSVRPKPPTPAPAPPDPGSPVTIAFKSSGRGTVICSGSRTTFDGPATINLEGYQLPVSCLVTIDGTRGVFQVYKSGAVSCDKTGTDVVCSPAKIQ